MEGRSLPQQARELTHLKNGLLQVLLHPPLQFTSSQVFLCLECLPFESVFDDVAVVEGEDLVPSLQGLAAMALAEAGEGLHTLPEKVGY